MKGQLSASLMCADLLNLESELTRLQQLQVEYLHFDFMDGRFVPNITFGNAFIRAFRKAFPHYPVDIHIMAFEPQQYFDVMGIGKGDLVSVHFEACEDVHAVLADLRARGARPLLAISPDTPVDAIVPYLDELDGVLVMTVYPGDSGKPLAPHSMERLAATRALLDATGRHLILEVDGCVSWANAPKMRQAGTDLFVLGSSSVFEKGGVYEETVPRFRQLIQ